MSKIIQLAVCVAAFTLVGSLANAQAVLSVDPTTQTTSTGNIVTVDVNISNVSDLYGYQFDLAFNPSVLQAISSSEGPFLATGGSTFFIPDQRQPRWHRVRDRRYATHRGLRRERLR